jgi:5-methylcytosine-specific restriction endonuclease McrA
VGSIPLKKTCTKCKVEKPNTAFGFSRASKDGLFPRCKKCRSEEYEAKAEEVREERRKYREEHGEKARESCRKSREKHLEKRRAGETLYRLKNPEKRKASKARYYEANKDKVKAKIREWVNLHPGIGSVYSRRRRAQQEKLSGSHTLREWNDLKAYYDHRCLCCWRQEPEIKLTADHVIPVVGGGNDTVQNLQPVCQRCNSRKHTKTTDYRPEAKRRLGHVDADGAGDG